MDGISAKIPQKICVFLQDQDIHARAGQKKSGNHPRRSAAHYAASRVHDFRGGGRLSHRLVRERLGEPLEHVGLPVLHRWIVAPTPHPVTAAFYCNDLTFGTGFLH
jgi:hypothetical protein